MRRSLRLHVFLRLLLCAALVIVVNRLIAQQLLREQVVEQAYVDMQDSILACKSFDLSYTDLDKCIVQIHRGEIQSGLASQYKFCFPAKAVNEKSTTGFCSTQPETQTTWKTADDPQFEYTQTKIEGTDWIAVRMSDATNRLELWLSTERVDHFVMRMWQWRDKTIIYVLPAVLLLLAVMALYMTRFVIGVLDELKQTLSTLNVRNIDTRVQIVPHFRELEPLASVFEQMQVRLEKSFDQCQRFVSDASHELRTPLSILRGQAQRLIDESESSSDTQRQLRSIADEVERLIDIVNKLLLLSQADSKELYSQMTLINMSALLSSFIQDVQALESDVLVQSIIKPDLWLYADEVLITQLVQNLFSNALKYNIPGGWVRTTLVQRHDVIELRIENTTGKLRPELQEHAFERFFRGDKSRSRQTGGLGLGLSICQEIARVHLGALDIEITQENTFVIKFVAATPRAQQ